MIRKQKGRVQAQWFAEAKKKINTKESFKNQDHAHCPFFFVYSRSGPP